jgi:hypothetical protein
LIALLVRGLSLFVLGVVGLTLLLSGLVPAVFAALVLLVVAASPLLLVMLGILATASIESPEQRTGT